MPAPTLPRIATVWCPDWPVVAVSGAADVELPDAPAALDLPIAVLSAGQIVACSRGARGIGVRRGMRKREAQARCPDLMVLARDEAVEARCFEPAIRAVEDVVAGVEVVRPGLLMLAARGPARHLGGEAQLVAALRAAVGRSVPEVSVGIADGAFAAEQAARRDAVVPAGGSGAFLADLPIGTLDCFGDSALVDVLRRLGIWTLGAFAALPARDVAARFGPAGAWAHRQAGGRDAKPVVVREPPADCSVTVDLEPPVDRVDVIAFSMRSAVETFVANLSSRALACACVELEVTSELGERASRRWRASGVLSASDVIDRLRWQIEGWLHGGDDVSRVTSGIARVRIVPVETVPSGVHQQGLWGGDGETGERARRALARVQTMLGFEGVLAPSVTGGRGPAQRTLLTPWGEERAPARSVEHPWPGRLPSPAPSVVLNPPAAIDLLDVSGRPVVVGERGAVLRPPTRLRLGREAPAGVTSWAGPWPADERWWDPSSAVRIARMQVVDETGRAFLVAGEMASGDAPRWVLEGIYD
ncbi:MAG TPA: DNA polymerase Y family protein [Mycobacteriales bacterium]|nr:DNA polymerase Y family protein [Mycobacteriales bacterium]